MISLKIEVNQYAKTVNFDSIKITVDINFDNTICEILISNDECEDTVLESLGKHHFKEIAGEKVKSQLYFFLNNNPSAIINQK